MDDEPTGHLAKRWTLTLISGLFSVALALLFVLVLRSIAVQISPPPEPRNEPYPDVSSEELCAEAGGRWVLRSSRQGVPERPVPEPLADDVSPYCQGPLAFEREQTIQRERSSQTSLFVFAVGGAIAVASSLLIVQLRPVAPGLMIGGIVAFFISGVQIWQLAPGIGRLIVIVVIFVILTGVGLYVFREKSQPNTI